MKYRIDYNGKPTGKQFKTLKEAKAEWRSLAKKGLWGYTICKYV